MRLRVRTYVGESATSQRKHQIWRGKERDIFKIPYIEICQMNMYDNLSGCLGSYDMQTNQILSSYNIRH